jgi:DNA ligase-1
MIDKPMLASTVDDIKHLLYPLMVSPKIDGIRALMRDGHLVSRALKPIPNPFIRNHLEGILPEGADGEIISGNSFQTSTSAIMRRYGEPEFRYCMFDLYSHQPYEKRVAEYMTFCAGLAPSRAWVQAVPVTLITNERELLEYEVKVLAEGFEGVMIRSPGSPYKFGRSTLREQWLVKLKRFKDGEAIILRCDEANHNANPAEMNNLGHTHRSTAKDGKVPAGWLGSFWVADRESGVEFGIGTGFTLAQRQEIWASRDDYIGQIVKYRYQPVGVKDAPRFPLFLGFRDELDL